MPATNPMTPAQSDPPSYVFDGWELRPPERSLLVGGAPAKIGGRAYQLLLALAQRAGRAVSKDELLRLAWQGVVVEENNLTVQITALRKLLGADAIVTVPGLGYRLSASPRGAAAPVAALPAGVVGREAELQALRGLVGRVPLVTVVGMGGVGKTTLARAVTAPASGHWPDGVHWLELAPVPAGTPFLPLVARALGVLNPEAATEADLLLSLAPRRALVVLDNCEHLLASASAGLAALLAAAPGLHWLATTQEPLGVAGERVFRVAPLAVAAPDSEPEEALRCPALALFAQRAAAAGQALGADPAVVRVALEICRALDGLPLALEMAAARVPLLGLRGLLEQLQRRLVLRGVRRDVPARHQTLLDTFAWSYGLLAAPEQRLFRRLQPFQGGFTASQLPGVAEAPDAPTDPDMQALALDVLLALVGKSLVQRMPGGGEAAEGQPRFQLLECARDFASLRLAEAGEAAAAQQVHARRVADTLAPAWDDLFVLRDSEWLMRYAPESDNVRAALRLALALDDDALLAQLVTAAALLASMAHVESELLHAGVPVARLAAAPPQWRARAGLEFGWSQFVYGQRESGTQLIEQALRDFEALDDVPGVHLARVRLIRAYQRLPGRAAAAQGLWQQLQAMDPVRVPLRLRLYMECTVARSFDGDPSAERLQTLWRVARRAGYDLQAAIAATNLTDELLLRERFEDVVQAADEALAERPAGLVGMAFVTHNQVHALVRLGRLDDARRVAARMLRAAPGQAHMLVDLFAHAAVRGGQWHDAALMAGFSARVRRERNWLPDPAEAQLIEAMHDALRQALGPQQFERLLDFGAGLPARDALALAGLA